MNIIIKKLNTLVEVKIETEDVIVNLGPFDNNEMLSLVRTLSTATTELLECIYIEKMK